MMNILWIFDLKDFKTVLIARVELNAALTLNGFDDQERNLAFVKTDFQVLKLKFYACNFNFISSSYRLDGRKFVSQRPAKS